MSAIDRIAAGESFYTSREAIQEALAEYEGRYGPLTDPDPDVRPGGADFGEDYLTTADDEYWEGVDDAAI